MRSHVQRNESEKGVRASPGGEHPGTPAQQLFQGTRFRALALPTAAPDSAVHFTPLAAATFIAWTGGATWPISIYLIVLGIITLVAATVAPETAGKQLK